MYAESKFYCRCVAVLFVLRAWYSQGLADVVVLRESYLVPFLQLEHAFLGSTPFFGRTIAGLNAQATRVAVSGFFLTF